MPGPNLFVDARIVPVDGHNSLQRLVDWLYGTDMLSSAPVEQKARLVLLDTLGCFIAALSRPEPLALLARFSALEPGVVRLPGVAGGLSVLRPLSRWRLAPAGMKPAKACPGPMAGPACTPLPPPCPWRLPAATAWVKRYRR